MQPIEILKQDFVLENQRVLLQPLSVHHFEELLPIAMEPDLWTVSMDEIRNREDLHKYIQEALLDRSKGIGYPFVIFDKKSGGIVGCTRYCEIVLPFKRLEIGWTWLSEAARGSGVNQACKFELLTFAFDRLAMNRVELKTDRLNLRSRAAIKKIGATEEGILRSHMITESGRVRDTVMHSILSSEWPGIRKEIFREFIR